MSAIGRLRGFSAVARKSDKGTLRQLCDPTGTFPLWHRNASTIFTSNRDVSEWIPFFDDHEVGKAEVYPGMTLPVANRIARRSLTTTMCWNGNHCLGARGHDCENPWGHDPETSHLGARHRIPLNKRTRSPQPVIGRAQYPEARTVLHQGHLRLVYAAEDS